MKKNIAYLYQLLWGNEDMNIQVKVRQIVRLRENLKAKCIFCGVTQKGYIEEILDIVDLSDAGKKKAKKAFFLLLPQTIFSVQRP